MTGKNKPPGKRGAHRVTVIAHLTTIEEMIREGHTLRSIFEEITGLSSMSYPVFTHHVRKYLTLKRPSLKRVEAATRPLVEPTDVSNTLADHSPEPLHRLPDRKPVFEHDPDSAKKRDDLI
ncbi:TraK family protein [Brucella sp. NBRC 12950]|uniref:TraK family protein n=1 Tax=Brucella sp. NBRC 12950 TaxID=2994518 RepID=UPI0025550E00|nr:TraK family protein [Brucella sp. NBRC 12950]